MAAPRRYPDEMRDRSVRLVADLVEDPELQLSVTAACTRVGEQLGVNRDTLRGWVKQAQIDAGALDRRAWFAPVDGAGRLVSAATPAGLDGRPGTTPGRNSASGRRGSR